MRLFEWILNSLARNGTHLYYLTNVMICNGIYMWMEAPVISLKWMESPFIRWNWMKSPFIPYTIVTGMEQREFKKDTLIWNGIQWFKESCYGMILNNKSILWQSKNIVIEHKKKRHGTLFKLSSCCNKKKHWYEMDPMGC